MLNFEYIKTQYKLTNEFVIVKIEKATPTYQSYKAFAIRKALEAATNRSVGGSNCQNMVQKWQLW